MSNFFRFRRSLLIRACTLLIVALASGHYGGSAWAQSGATGAGSRTEKEKKQPYKVGDRVVLKDSAKLFLPKKVVGQLPKGVVVTVLVVNDRWVWVRSGKAGWLAQNSVIPLDQAAAYFTAEIQRNKNDASAFASRGHVWRHLEQYPKAISDYDEALRLKPDDVFTIRNRAFTKYLQGAFAAAIADYDTLLKRKPKDAVARNDRGHNYYLLKQYAKALRDYDAALGLNPQDALTLNNRAWLLATCPDANLRDGKQAVANALRACQLTDQKNYDYLDTLAAAYAESGDFRRAEQAIAKAIQLAPKNGGQELQERLAGYRRQVPYRGD